MTTPYSSGAWGTCQIASLIGGSAARTACPAAVCALFLPEHSEECVARHLMPASPLIFLGVPATSAAVPCKPRPAGPRTRQVALDHHSKDL